MSVEIANAEDAAVDAIVRLIVLSRPGQIASRDHVDDAMATIADRLHAVIELGVEQGLDLHWGSLASASGGQPQ